MVNVSELRAEIARNNLTQKQVYEGIGLTKRQWDLRMQKHKFDSDEMQAICKYLSIQNPMPIFFA